MISNERDFTSCRQNSLKSYLGANGSKRCFIIDGEDYMVKFPASPTKETELSYTNSCISEYIGCHIFELAGIPVQKTILGTYTTDSGKKKIVVACKDFRKPGVELIPFAGLKNQIIDSPRNGYGTELADILESFEKQDLFSFDELKERFWDMFIVDALIGNWDRHNGNWGYLYDSINNTVSLAPVYDCGSSLFPQADESTLKGILENKNELNYRVYSIPLSSIKINDKKINYRDFISSLKNEDCNRALKKIYPRLTLDGIAEIIDKTPYITDLQKNFFSKILESRHELILASSYRKLLKIERNASQSKNTSIYSLNSDSLGKEYVNKILEYSIQLPLKEATLKAHEELINANPAEKKLKQQLLNNYFVKLGIKNNSEFISYINKLKTTTKKVVPKVSDYDLSR